MKNKWLHLSFWVLGIFLIVILLKKFLCVEFGQFSSPSFLFNYLGVLLGFALTLYTFIISQHESIENRIDSKYVEKDKNLRMRNLLSDVFTEVGDDVKLIFYSLVIVVFLFIFEGLILEIHPYIIDYYESFVVMIFVLSILSIKDLISVSFSIGDLLGVNKTKK